LNSQSEEVGIILTSLSHAGPFLFVNRVLPLLKNALKERDNDVRIINLSSLAHVSMLPQTFKFTFDSAACLSNPVPSHPWQWRWFGRFIFGFDMVRYAVSKAAVVLFTKELQQQLDEQGLPIITIAVHPGEVATEGVMAINNAFIKTLARISFLTPEQGSATPIFAATAKEVRQNAGKYKGKFLVPFGRVEAPNTVVEDDGQVKGLWKNTTREINKRLVSEGLPLLDMW
jgi:NAD(P)-dependent dehydrogenase (short-subunit alcohol dehydrogenase family)